MTPDMSAARKKNWRPTATLSALQQRSQCIQTIRRFFHEHDYFEVETPVLSQDCCVDAWLDPFPVAWGRGTVRYLQTSPEFAMKRLVAAGADRIFQLARVFRQDESGPRHNPEFTLLEWYAQGTTHHDQMDFVEQLIRWLAAAPLSPNASPPALPMTTIPRWTYQGAFVNAASVDPFAASLDELRRCSGVDSDTQGRSLDRDELLNQILADSVEPQLASQPAVFLHSYPASQAALAQLSSDGSTAERFELYLQGVEICNGYHELQDPVELRRRMERENTRRGRAGKPLLPVDSYLLAAMQEGFPQCSGVALGLDRLIAWRIGASTILELIAFPADSA